VAEARRLIQKALKGKVRKLQFLDDRTLQLAQRFAKPYQWLTGLNLPEMLKLLLPVYSLMKGIPTKSSITSTYWRKKIPVPVQVNPEQDGCGLIWCAPIAPLDGQHAAVISMLVADTLAIYEFEPIISITLLTERCLSCVITISYDRDVSGEDERAMECYNNLLQKLTQAGYYPYRLGIQSMTSFAAEEESYKSLLHNIKTTLDPNAVLAPGRYTGCNTAQGK